ncbi:MAG: XdhC family protein [Firmicutes bacterium]|jgi:xanthine dehydrogenase accessory factor|uniref:TRASH domain-containing protein n=1 Tax=Sulfobacillus benefaciens TaxID=453960 RepID=A0A2T2X102_9FIRM|nr:XdhC family protein [Bacillota bacterium]PSR28152.1 MAG: hypothetical protein C7B43_10545 [Sulfobacillus benefaciens]
MDTVLEEAVRRDAAGESYVMVTVLRTRAPTSAIAGARALIGPNNEVRGYIGGECTRRTVLEVAAEALADGRPRLVLLSSGPEREVSRDADGLVVRPMTCDSGGTVELFVEPRLANPLLLVIGHSPVSVYLADMARHLPFRLKCLDINQEGDWEAFGQNLRAVAAQGGFVVSCTMGQYDEWVVEQIGEAPICYLGVVSSPRRGEVLRARLKEIRGSSDVLTVSIPAGWDLHTRDPGEIAVSILAEIIAIRREMSSSALAESRTGAEKDAAEPIWVIDPVCRMQVNWSETPYRTVYGGERIGFCQGSCRDAFLKEPEKYVSSVPGGQESG